MIVMEKCTLLLNTHLASCIKGDRGATDLYLEKNKMQ